MSPTAQPQADDALLAELARSVVQDVAPRELPLFPATSAAYFRDPAAVTRRRAGDDKLGFGVALGTLMTPVVLAVLGEVLKVVWAEVSAGAREAGRDAVKERVRQLFTREGGAPEGLSAAQRDRVRAQALASASALLPPAQAALLADAIAGKLA